MGIRSFSQSMRRPSRSPWPTRLAWAAFVLGSTLFIAVVARNLRRHDSLTEWRQTLEEATGRPAWPEWSPTWPSLPTPPQRPHELPQDLQGAYAYAARHQEVLQHIPCYCGCVREGHRSNLHCFVSSVRPDGAPVWTDHSFSCSMCVHIAREAMLMTSQGIPLQQAREEIDKRYDVFGEGTPTPLPERNRE
ncbi:MAG: PCYCGC motif-containing (lipo)protein [Vicinamibacterales bacterium]